MSESTPYVPEVISNNSGRYKTFSITRNSTHDANQLLVDLKAVGEVRRVVIGREKAPTTGTLHLQCAVTFKTARTVDSLTRKGLGHVEPARSTEKLFKYCQKEGDFIEEGQPGGEQGKRTDLERATALLREGGLVAVAQEAPTEFVKYHRGFAALQHALTLPRKFGDPAPGVYWCVGETGCGKTRTVYELSDGGDPSVLWTSNDDLNWFDGYNGQRIALLDDFRGDQCKYAKLLKVLDRYPRMFPIKGSFVHWKPRTVYITSTLAPHETYPNLKGNDGIKQLLRRLTCVVDDTSAFESADAFREFVGRYEEGSHVKKYMDLWSEQAQAVGTVPHFNE